jgi:CRISPR/Cas system Type II protein with McrA/HNH and RuvC-like nuclease domain
MRFEVFKRDGFKCSYCGQSPPTVVLEVDHVDPVSRGGKNDINNYVTACFDCNRGKSNVPLNKIPNQLSDNLGAIKEKEEQISEYRKYIAKIDRRTQRDINKIARIFTDCFDGYELQEKNKRISIKKFLSLLPWHEIIEGIYTASGKFEDDPQRGWRYFCGVCWTKIRTNNAIRNAEDG